MKLFDLESSQTKQSQKVMESYFHRKVNFTALAPAKANSMLKKVRNLISEHRSINSLHTSEKDAGYMKLLVMERGLTARLAMREADMPDPMVTQSLNKIKSQQTINPAEQNALAKKLNTNTQSLTKALAGTAVAGPDKAVADQLTGMLSTVESKESMSKLKSNVDSAFNAIMKKDPGDEGIGFVFDKFASKMSDNDASRLARKLAKFYPEWYEQHYQNEGKDIGKPGKNFAKIAKSAGKKYGSKAAGERVAGSILKKLRNENAKVRMNGRYLTENEVQQAQVVLAAQDMVDRIQDMLEDVTAMQFKDLPALSTSISSTVGTNEAQAFNNAASAALAQLVDAVQTAKVGMESAQGTLTGQEPVVPGAEEVSTVDDMDVADEFAVDADTDIEVDVDVEEPEMNSLGRARR